MIGKHLMSVMILAFGPPLSGDIASTRRAGGVAHVTKYFATISRWIGRVCHARFAVAHRVIIEVFVFWRRELK